jgi:hypothetical protein
MEHRSKDITSGIRPARTPSGRANSCATMLNVARRHIRLPRRAAPMFAGIAGVLKNTPEVLAELPNVIGRRIDAPDSSPTSFPGSA